MKLNVLVVLGLLIMNFFCSQNTGPFLYTTKQKRLVNGAEQLILYHRKW